MSQTSEKRNGSSKWLAILVVLIAVIIMFIWIYSWIKWIIWGMIFLLIVIPMILNRKLVSRAYNYIKGLYKKHTALGVLGTIGGVVAFLPFATFLLGKTIWEFFKPKGDAAKIKAAAGLGDIIPLEKNAPKIDHNIDLDEDYLNDINSKYPPTEQ